MSIGDRVKELREALGLTQEQVAIRSKELKREEMSRIEAGRNQLTTLRTREAVARGFGVSMNDLSLFFEGSMSLPDLIATRTRPARTVLDIPPEQVPLHKAVEFLRDELPDEFLDEALATRGYDGLSKDTLVQTLRGRFGAWLAERNPDGKAARDAKASADGDEIEAMVKPRKTTNRAAR